MPDPMRVLPPELDRPLRHPATTNLLLGMCGAVVVYDALSGGAMTADGVLVAPAVWTEGQYHRLILAMFLHAGLLHLVVTTVLLLLVGTVAERLYGRVRVALTWSVAALAGGLSSLAFRPEELAVTASAGLMGLVGLLAALTTFRAGALPEGLESRLKGVLTAAILAFTLLGLLVPEANVAVHLGGLLAGLLLGGALEPVIKVPRRPVLAVLALVAVPTGLGFLLHYAPGRAGETLVAETIRAQELSLIGRPAEGIAILERALARPLRGGADHAWLAEAQNALAWLYVETGQKIDAGIELSLESNNRLRDSPALLDTLGYLYALAGRCRDAADAMGRAVELDAGYAARRDEVTRACEQGRRPNPDLPIAPPASRPSPRPRRGLDA